MGDSRRPGRRHGSAVGAHAQGEPQVPCLVEQEHADPLDPGGVQHGSAEALEHLARVQGPGQRAGDGPQLLGAFPAALDRGHGAHALQRRRRLLYQAEPVTDAQPFLRGIFKERCAVQILHNEVGPPLRCAPRIVDTGDVGVIHHRQRLPFLPEAGDDLLGVHAQLDNFERHAPPHRLLLIGDPHRAKPALADLLAQLVRPDARAGPLTLRIGNSAPVAVRWWLATA